MIDGLSRPTKEHSGPHPDHRVKVVMGVGATDEDDYSLFSRARTRSRTDSPTLPAAS